MMSDETYNGWSNYPTWCVNLWLANEQPLYEETRYRVGAVMDEGRVAVADAIKGYVVDELAPDLGASFAADLLGFALASVDWFELADAWLEDVRESAVH